MCFMGLIITWHLTFVLGTDAAPQWALRYDSMAHTYNLSLMGLIMCKIKYHHFSSATSKTFHTTLLIRLLIALSIRSHAVHDSALYLKYPSDKRMNLPPLGLYASIYPLREGK